MVVKLPGDLRWKIRHHPSNGSEWIEEDHRIWKIDATEIDGDHYNLDIENRDSHSLVRCHGNHEV